MLKISAIVRQRATIIMTVGVRLLKVKQLRDSVSKLLTLQSAEAIIVPHRIIWSSYSGRWWVGCYIWYSEEGPGRGPSPPRFFLAVPNVTAPASTARIPITVLLYNGLLLCGLMCPQKVKWNGRASPRRHRRRQCRRPVTRGFHH